MALRVSPRAYLDDMVKGGEAAYRLNLNPELNGNTVAFHTFKIYDSAEEEVSSNFSGSSIEDSGYITFGVKAHDIGLYIINFWVTCNELIPDSITPYEFPVKMKFRVNNI